MRLERTPREMAIRAVQARSVKPKNPRANSFGDFKIPGFTTRFIRRFVTSTEEDKRAFFRRRQEGWEVATVEDLGVEKYGTLAVDGHIEQDGCILMKIPELESQAYQAYYEDQAVRALAGVEETFVTGVKVGDVNGGGRGFVETHKTKVIRGKRSE